MASMGDRPTPLPRILGHGARPSHHVVSRGNNLGPAESRMIVSRDQQTRSPSIRLLDPEFGEGSVVRGVGKHRESTAFPRPLPVAADSPAMTGGNGQQDNARQPDRDEVKVHCVTSNRRDSPEARADIAIADFAQLTRRWLDGL